MRVDALISVGALRLAALGLSLGLHAGLLALLVTRANPPLDNVSGMDVTIAFEDPVLAAPSAAAAPATLVAPKVTPAAAPPAKAIPATAIPPMEPIPATPDALAPLATIAAVKPSAPEPSPPPAPLPADASDAPPSSAMAPATAPLPTESRPPPAAAPQSEALAPATAVPALAPTQAEAVAPPQALKAEAAAPIPASQTPRQVLASRPAAPAEAPSERIAPAAPTLAPAQAEAAAPIPASQALRQVVASRPAAPAPDALAPAQAEATQSLQAPAAKAPVAALATIEARQEPLAPRPAAPGAPIPPSSPEARLAPTEATASPSRIDAALAAVSPVRVTSPQAVTAAMEPQDLAAPLSSADALHELAPAAVLGPAPPEVAVPLAPESRHAAEPIGTAAALAMLTEPSGLANIAKIHDFIDHYDGGDCFFAAPAAISQTSAEIDAFSASRDKFDTLDAAFMAAVGLESHIVGQKVERAQCPLVDFLRSIGQPGAETPLLLLDRRDLVSGDTLTGTLRRTGDRQVGLFLITQTGLVQDMTARMTARDGVETFTLPLRQDQAGGPSLQILLAVASPRSVGTAPGSMPQRLEPFLQALLQEAGAAGAGSAGLQAAAKGFLLRH